MRVLISCFVLSVAISGPGCGKDSKKSSGSGQGSGKAQGRGRGAAAGPADVRPVPKLRARLRVRARPAPLPAMDAPREAPLALAKGDGKGSWKLIRPVAVFRRPDTKAPIRATIKKFTRVPRVTRVDGPGCPQGFLKLADEAYVCLLNLRKDRRPPRARPQPTLGANHLTPGTYGYIRTGGAKLYWTLADGFADRKGKPIAQSDTVRWAGKRFFKGMKFWRITTGHFIRGNRVRRFWPSHLKGVDLRRGGHALPLVFMVSRRRRHIGEKIPPVDVYEVPRGRVVSTLERYTAWPTDDVRQGPEFRWYHIPKKGWVSSEMVRLARLTDPPPGLHPDERWIDVDLEEQTLVAYRGRTPVYATLVAAGVWKYPSPVGVFRIYRKVAEANMKSDETASESYRVDHVPWTMYFNKGYALHGAYWHDGFGHARSHGCINLAPRDARVIYQFTRPVVPDGWTRMDADAAHPGTAVRLRGKAAKPKPADKPADKPKEKAPARPRPRP